MSAEGWRYIPSHEISSTSVLSHDEPHSAGHPTAACGLPPSAPYGTHMNNEQVRASRQVRRRSRASKKTPTTLLNTDTTNFRAMVQQFTGGPSVSFAHNESTTNPTFSGFTFGFDPAQVEAVPNSISYQYQFLEPGGRHSSQHQQVGQPLALDQSGYDQFLFSMGSVAASNDSIHQQHRLGNVRGNSSEVTASGLGGGGRVGTARKLTTSGEKRIVNSYTM